MPLKNQYATSY